MDTQRKRKWPQLQIDVIFIIGDIVLTKEKKEQYQRLYKERIKSAKIYKGKKYNLSDYKEYIKEAINVPTKNLQKSFKE